MGNTILIGISSGIAAFKVVSLVSNLRRRGLEVIVLMTEHSKKMISPAEFEKASGNKVASELFPADFDYRKILKKRRIEHISLADKASVICIVPATANIIAKIANGIADDLLTTTVLASRAALLFCPSMNVNMWNNKLTQENIGALKEMGAFFVEPEEGDLACGYRGKGRLAEINKLEREILKLVTKIKQLSGKRIIVTAGGTEEAIDNVRVITNKSSGKMGIFIAEECVKRGAEVTLIRARTNIEPSAKMKEIKVTNANQMFKEVKNNVPKNDIVIHAAAVSDFTVSNTLKGKVKSDKSVILELIPNIKIIDQIRKWNKNVFLIGFKVSNKDVEREAEKLLHRSRADFIVGNSSKYIGTDYNDAFIMDKRKLGG